MEIEKNENSVEIEKKEPWQKRLFKDCKELVYILVIFMLVYVLCFRMVVVVGDSMYDSLVDGDRLLIVSNTLYKNPQAGDIIVASKDSFREGECIIKRIIATEGQVVDIDGQTGTVYVDGVALDEPYIHSVTYPNYMEFPLTVAENCYFVMGDNRMDSLDSRSAQIGQIDKREILGKAIFILLPGTDGGRVDADYGRIGVIG